MADQKPDDYIALFITNFLGGAAVSDQTRAVLTAHLSDPALKDSIVKFNDRAAKHLPADAKLSPVQKMDAADPSGKLVKAVQGAQDEIRHKPSSQAAPAQDTPQQDTSKPDMTVLRKPVEHVGHAGAHTVAIDAHQPPQAACVDYDSMTQAQKDTLHQGEKDLTTGYDVDGFGLSADQQKQIDAQLGAMQDIVKGGHKVRLNGRTSTTGSKDHNTDLGYARAEGVRQYLLTKGFTADQIEVTSAGKQDLEKPTGDSVEEAANRNVTVSTGSDYQPKPAPAPEAAAAPAVPVAAAPAPDAPTTQAAAPPADQSGAAVPPSAAAATSPTDYVGPPSGGSGIRQQGVYGCHGNGYRRWPPRGWLPQGPCDDEGGGRGGDLGSSYSAVDHHGRDSHSRYMPDQETRDEIVPQFAAHDQYWRKNYGGSSGGGSGPSGSQGGGGRGWSGGGSRGGGGRSGPRR